MLDLKEGPSPFMFQHFTVIFLQHVLRRIFSCDSLGQLFDFMFNFDDCQRIVFQCKGMKAVVENTEFVEYGMYA